MYSHKRESKIERERIERLIKWHKGERAAPIKIDVELHKRCNLKCLPCSRQASDFDLNKESMKKEMPLEKWLEIINEAKELGILIWNIEGANEPMAVPELTMPVIKKVKENGMYGIITTNGTLWNEDLIKELVEVSCDRIHFSLDSSNGDVHDYLRGVPGSFNKTVENIRLLNKWKKKLNTESPMLNINIIITKKNYKELPEFVEFCHELLVDYIFVEPLMIFHENAKDLRLNEEERKELPNIISMAKNIADKYGIDNNFATDDKNLNEDFVKSEDKKEVLLNDSSGDENTLLMAPCFKCWNNMTIKYDGLCGHCGLINDGEYIQEKSLKEIWFGNDLESIREKMLKKELLDHCSNCVPSDITQRRRFRKELEISLGE
tara:strand:- start:3833 stop:4966 length:1134 start_codon:yes stop_codon:yes gene_type:complete